MQKMGCPHCRDSPFCRIFSQKLHAAVFDVVHRADDAQAHFLLDVVDAQALLDLLHAVLHVQAAGLVGVGLLADGLFDLIGDVLDVTAGLVVDGGIHRAAMGVAQHHHQPAPQVSGGVLDAAQLVVVDDVARQPDDEQLADARREDALGDNTAVRAGDDDGIGRLALCPAGMPGAAGDIPRGALGVEIFQVAGRQLVDGVGRGADGRLAHDCG